MSRRVDKIFEALKNAHFQLNSEDSDCSETPENISTILSDMNVDDTQDIRRKNRSLKHDIDKNTWDKNKNSSNGEKGKSFKGKKKENGKWRYDLLKEPRSMKGTCNCKLSRNEKSALMCSDINENERKKIFEDCWKCTWSEKKMFVKNHVCIQEKSRKRSLYEVSTRTFSNILFQVSREEGFEKKCF